MRNVEGIEKVAGSAGSAGRRAGATNSTLAGVNLAVPRSRRRTVQTK